MKKKRILIVDDEPKIVRILSANLKSIGFAVSGETCGEDALAAVDLYDPDLILLDIMMPRMDGFAALEKLRLFNDAPVIMLTARDRSEDKVRALNMGADDYLTKPFSIEEVFARVKAVLRRSEKYEFRQRPAAKIYNGAVSLFLDASRVLAGGEEIRFTSTEYKLFALLMQNLNMVMTHEQLLEAVWGPEYIGDIEYLRVAVARIRQKLKKRRIENYITTYSGIGYSIKKIADPSSIP